MAYRAPLPSLNRQKRERCYNLDYSNLEFADLNTGQRRISRQSTKWAKAPDSITYSFDNNARFYVNLMGTGCGCNKLTFSCWFLAGLALPHCIQNSTHFPSHLFQNWMQKKKKNQSLHDLRHFFTAHAAQRKQNIQVHLEVWQNHLTNVREPFLKCCSTCYQTFEGPVSRGNTQKFSILALVIASPSKATVFGNMFILLPKTSLPTTLTLH